MKILITGGAGYIGSHCYYAFTDNNIKTVVLDNLSIGHRSLLPANCIFYHGDIADANLLDQILQEHNIDTVLHCAGSVIVNESVINPTLYYENNTSKSLDLLKACVRNNVKNFIFSSTASVYGNADTKIVSETTPIRPLTPYAASKMIIETMIQHFAQAYGINYIILRYFNVAGCDPQHRTGQISVNATHLIKVACEAAVGKRNYVQIFGTNYDTRDGTGIRDYIHVSDLATVHLYAANILHNTNNKYKDKIFNCGYGHGYSVREVLTTLSTLSPSTIPIIESTRRDGDIAEIIADSSLLRHATNWKPQYDDIRLILASALEWEKKLASGT